MADYTAPVAGNLFDSPDLDFYAASQSGMAVWVRDSSFIQRGNTDDTPTLNKLLFARPTHARRTLR